MKPVQTKPASANAARLTSRINSYVDKLKGFNGAKWGEDEVKSFAILGRALRLVVPKGAASAEQSAAISVAKARAGGLGIKLIVTPL
jgi:hypothetical protein